MDRFLSIEAFVRVAQTQSFAEAARQLRLSRAVVTTRVQQLEEVLGDALFHRTTRTVRLSEMGQAFYRDCLELVTRTNDLVDQMREVRGTPAGLLRVHALTGFMLGHAASLLREFQERYPDIVLDLFVSDAVIDPVKQGFDVALQIFKPVSDELVSRRLFPVRRVFCASSEYLLKHGSPRMPRDLFGHRLGLYSGYPTRDRWTFHRAGEDSVTLDLKPVLMSNSVHLLRDYVCEHAGIVCLPTLVAAEGLCSGRLRIVLPDYQLSAFWLSAVYARTLRGAFKLRLFIESLGASFSGGEPPWDKALIEQGLTPPQLLED
ncbi:LysR family transcriptional regulator [Azohydromonas lata]|uniref:LysR family transcriptional regulator n=1 Tax=Azohydromonas lata TaxID=45677 RepID=A0ABU5IB09_9BURK|nr:LysR family transcriptional regulator [Azohydromonas lata]MDZ5456297.1 LysR family transcriptional regulator [Azohydromonas lata]